MGAGRSRSIGRAVVYLVMVCSVAYMANAAVFRFLSNLGMVVQTVVVFGVLKLVADGLALLIYPPREPIFGEDFLRDLVLFVGVGAVAGVGIQLAGQFIGGQVPPGIPAAGGYFAFQLASTKR